MALNLFDTNEIGTINKFGDNQEIVIAKRTLPYRIFPFKVTDIEFAAHKVIELIYVIEGKVKLQVRNHTRILNKGDFHIVNSNKAHCIRQYEGGHILLCFQICPEYLERDFGITRDYIFSNDITDIVMKKNIEYAMGLLYIESLNDPNKFDVKGKGINILVDSIRPYLISKEYMDVIDSEHTAEYIVHDIVEKYSDTLAGEDITLAKMALEYNTSYSYLSRMFKTVTGINFTDYFSKQKLNRATDLLLNTNKTITDISVYSGFADVKILNKHFQHAFSMSPTKLRHKYRDEKDKESGKWFFHDQYVKEFIRKIEIERDNQNYKRTMEDRVYNLDIKADARIKRKDWSGVIDLNCIIDSDISSLGYNLKKFNFQNIIINFKFEEGKFLLVTKNGALRKLLNSEINNLVRDLDHNNIIPIIQVDFISQNKEIFYRNEDIFYETYYSDIKASLDFISMIIGSSKLAKWKFELYIPEINKLIIKNQTSAILFKHITDFANMLKKRFGEGYSNWGIYIGQLEITEEKQDTRYIKELQKLCPKPGFYRLDLLYYHHNLPCEKKFPSLANNLNSLMDQVTGDLSIDSKDIKEKLIGGFNYIVDNIESPEEYNVLYYNLCLNIVMLNIKQNKFYIPSFKIIDSGMEGESDYHSFYNKYGIKSTFHYMYKFISKLKPDLTSNGNGYFATRDGDNLVILLYSDYRECYRYIEDHIELDCRKLGKNIILNINGLKGNYKVSEYQINYNNSTFYKRFMDNIGIETMTEEEQSYVQSRSMPEMKVNVLDVDESLKYSTELKLLDISLITIQSV